MTNPEREDLMHASVGQTADVESAEGQLLGLGYLLPKNMRSDFHKVVTAGLERAARHLPHRRAEIKGNDETEA